MISQLTFNMKKLIYLMLSSVLLTACGQRAHISDMQCEHLTSPLGIDATKPRFSWKFETEEKDFKQEAFQLRIASSTQLLKKNKPDIWSSDKKEASVSRCVYAGQKAFESHKTYYWDIIAWDNEQNKYKSKVDSFEMGKLLETDWQAKWITNQELVKPEKTTQFRKSFKLDKSIRSARVYISSLAYYHLFINNQQIADNQFDPGQTCMHKKMLYATYDITSNLKQDENAIAVELENAANISQQTVVSDTNNTVWTNQPAFLCELRITYSDGTVETINTDNTWKTNQGVANNNASTDSQDNNKSEETGWKAAGYNDRDWEYAFITEGPGGKLTADNLTGLLTHADLPQTGTFNCSDSLLNKIWRTTNHSYRSHLHSIPTNSPQRNKKGWMADAHIAIDLALLNFDGIILYEKWLNDFIDNQRENGDISGIIPSSSWGYGNWPGPVWDAALFIIPDALYNYYGDTRAIEKLYPTMQKYLGYLRLHENNGMLNFGQDNRVLYNAQTPNDYTSSVYYYLDNKLMAQFATLLGKDASTFSKKATELKTLINQKFFNTETGIYANGTQTALALALYMGIVPEAYETKVADNLHKKVAGNDFFLDFGLIGNKTVLAMLAKYGYVEDAYKMAAKTDAPSWGYWVESPGYSKQAETWTLSPQFRDASLNHVFLGDISTWMYNVLAGINYDTAHPGFQHIIIKPHFVNDLKWVEAEYNSARGLIKSSWKRKDKSIILQITIPPGATATVFADKTHQVGSGTHKYIINN